MSKTRVAVLYGGKSTEHEVSLKSAESVCANLNRDKYEVTKVFIDKDGKWEINPWTLPEICDFVLPILHGRNGEDGTVQGLLEILGLPYGGCGVLGSATAMDKVTSKKLFAQVGLRQTPYVDFIGEEYEANRELILERCNKELKYPLFVKPSNLGSSVGITKVKSPDKLHEAITYALQYDSRILVEQGVNCRELEIAAMGNETVELGAVGEINANEGFYDYDEKYADTSVSQLSIPAKISPAEEAELQAMAKIAYKVLGCCGFSRIDFMLDKDSGLLFINEINTIPGFTNISMFPKLFMEKGYSYSEILDRIIELGYERHNAENNRKDCY